jgi:hypothetical protein
MPTVSLPSSIERRMDSSVLAGLMRQAIRGAVAELAACSVIMSKREVYRMGAGGTGGSHLVEFPAYHAREVFDWLAKHGRSPEAMALLNYVWDHGALKKTITRDDDQIPTREAWEGFALLDLVHVPLLRALEWQAIGFAVDGESPKPWNIDETVLDEVVYRLARRYSERREEIVAVCPVVGIDLPGGEEIGLSSEITLRSWSPREKSIFLTRFHTEFRWDDFAVQAASCVVEMRATVSVGEHYGSHNPSWRAIFDKLDLLKWAVLASTVDPRPLVEGPCMILGAGGELLRSTKREERYSSGAVSLDGRTIAECRMLLERFRGVAANIPKLQDVVWHFGRACVAPLARDIVLDSVIGLEMMLVSGPGESRYRFSLHGATLLRGRRNRVELYEAFQNLYTQRSGAAHGASESDYDRVAADARRYLAATIRAVISLVESGQLAVTKSNIGKAVERYVLEQATR